ncbi:MAG TPA: hypothetical protein VNG90_02220 [Candidatus Acidoferrum sp.]|nr:hypothetical protein [Candidatus Acidoferrum sp.]
MEETNIFPISDPKVKARLQLLQKDETFVTEEEKNGLLWFPMWDQERSQWLIQVAWWWGGLVIYASDQVEGPYILLISDQETAHRRDDTYDTFLKRAFARVSDIQQGRLIKKALRYILRSGG